MIYVARHGETDWNRAGRYQGRRESNLTATGRAQAEALADALGSAAITRVISSPLGRCVQTAWPLARRLGLAVETEPLLMEIAHGTWEGRLRTDLQREDPERMRQWKEEPEIVTFEGGESVAQVDARWRAFMAKLGDADGVAVVTHDVVVRLAIIDARGEPLAALWKPHVVNGGYAEFRGGGSWELLGYVTAHLGALQVDTASQAL